VRRREVAARKVATQVWPRASPSSAGTRYSYRGVGRPTALDAMYTSGSKATERECAIAASFTSGPNDVVRVTELVDIWLRHLESVV